MASNNHAQQHQSPEAPRYPLPPPYFPPPGIHLETRTERGLRYINWGLWLYALVLFLSLILTAIIIFTTYDYGFGMFFVTAGLAMATFFIVLAVIILLLIGFVNMHSGKVEYGPIHFQKVTLALIFVVLYIAISVVQVFFSYSIIFYSGFGSDIDNYQNYSTNLLIVQAIFGFVSTLFLSLTWVFLIIELSSAETRILLWVSFGLSLAIFVGSFILQMTLGVIGSLSSGLVIIVLILVIYCYWRTYNRVRSREIMPLFPPGMFPPILPPGYFPQYPQGYQRYPPHY